MLGRRTSTRIAVDVEAKRPGAAGSHRVKELSIDGAVISGPGASRPGDHMNLQIELGAQGPLRVVAEIVGARRNGIGVKFIALGTRSRARILDYIFGDVH